MTKTPQEIAALRTANADYDDAESALADAYRAADAADEDYDAAEDAVRAAAHEFGDGALSTALDASIAAGEAVLAARDRREAAYDTATTDYAHLKALNDAFSTTDPAARAAALKAEARRLFDLHATR